MSHRARVVLLGVQCLLAVPAIADDATAQSHFGQGVSAFNAGQFQRAIRQFEAARAQGLSSDTLWYNLGVAYYKQGQLEQAEFAFSRLLTGANRELARYNLGLVALKAHQPEMAEAYFQAVFEHSASTKLRTLASRQLDQLSVPQSADTEQSWSASVDLNAGYDSNLSRVADGEPSFEGASFLESQAAGVVQIAGSRREGVLADGLLYSRQYLSNDQYDTDYMELGLSRSLVLGPGRGEARASLSQSWLDTAALERTFELTTSYRLAGCGFDTASASCKASLTGARVDAGRHFEEYDGQRFGAALELDDQWQGWQWRSRYRYDLNRRRDFQTASEFYSESPSHHELMVVGWHALTRELSFGTRLDYRFSRYRDEHRLVTPDGLLVERRVDHRRRAAFMLEYRLSAQWAATGEWDAQYNSSSLSRYEYARQVMLLGINGRF
ncbi:MAG: tetratricopeptide repeat protein [Marinobacter sp.]|nr:tetratricopeptide repeat protein [Marinobacter sp.]